MNQTRFLIERYLKGGWTPVGGLYQRCEEAQGDRLILIKRMNLDENTVRVVKRTILALWSDEVVDESAAV